MTVTQKNVQHMSKGARSKAFTKSWSGSSTPSYKCKHCDRLFKTLDAIKRHMLYKHAIVEMIYSHRND